MSYALPLKGNTHHSQRFTSRSLTVIQYAALALAAGHGGRCAPRISSELELGRANGRLRHPARLHSRLQQRWLWQTHHRLPLLEWRKSPGQLLSRRHSRWARWAAPNSATPAISIRREVPAGLSNLWGNGFNSFHGKVNFLPENFAKQKWVPAISAGFVARTQVYNVGGWIAGKRTNNADFYVVALQNHHPDQEGCPLS